MLAVKIFAVDYGGDVGGGSSDGDVGGDGGSSPGIHILSHDLSLLAATSCLESFPVITLPGQELVPAGHTTLHYTILPYTVLHHKTTIHKSARAYFTTLLKT